MKLLHPFKQLFSVATRSGEEKRGYLILPYRGYGTKEEVFMIGRVYYQPTSSTKKDGTSSLLREIGRRLLRRGVPDVEVEVRMGGTTLRVKTDGDGYFRVHFTPKDEPDPTRLWHNITVEMIDPKPEEGRVAVNGSIYIPPESARCAIISDIDDTVMHTGVANKIKMFWRLFAKDAESRVAFPGVASLYQAFLDGPSGSEMNPILYVSRGPWGIYDMLDTFFQAHRIPIGPILFLREWNVTLKSPLPRRAEDHKAELIRNMLDLYDDLPFVLIGDSGQHDPEIYADIVRANQGRIRAVYIRDVSDSSTRTAELKKLAHEIEEAGSSLVVADDTFVMARHAAEHGLISEDALEKVLEERVLEEEQPPEGRELVVEG